MGNSIAKEFKLVEVGTVDTIATEAYSSSKTTSLVLHNKDIIARGSVVLPQPVTVLVRHDDHRQSTIFFDFATMTPLFTSSTTKQTGGAKMSITRDRQGRPMFLTTHPSKTKTLIFRAPNDLPRAIRESSSCSSSVMDCSSNHSDASSSTNTTRTITEATRRPQQETNDCMDGPDVPCAAHIDLDRSGSCVSAFLSVVVWEGTGPHLRSFYKAVKVPQVKYGALVMNMQGVVVGKSSLDEQRMQPIIQVAQGADLPSVVATVSALWGEF
ncbi:hypothetical protein ACA910_005503 [Epithemia clementina (nom. ined.)]